MARPPLVLSPAYRAFARTVRALHRLTTAGQDESPEADAMRDATESVWPALSDIERKRLSGLSEDLYSISDPPDAAPTELNPQAQARLNDAIEARQHGDWDRALELLRRWGKHFSPALVSFLRGSVWSEAGDLDSALLFLEHATKLEPANGKYLTAFLITLAAVDPPAARRRADAMLADADHYPPAAVVRAAHLLLSTVSPGPNPAAADLGRRVRPVLEGALTRIEAGDEYGVDRVAYVNALALLGVCHEAEGEPQAAIDCYSRALQADPDNDALLLARGVLLYGVSPRAVTDLEHAIQHGSSAFLPYYLLAHHRLLTRRFDECLRLCDQASRREAAPRIRSELAEWTAIARAELGFAPDLVRAALDEAIRVDPSNDRARRNLERFDNLNRSAQPMVWETRSEIAVRASRDAEPLPAMAA